MTPPPARVCLPVRWQSPLSRLPGAVLAPRQPGRSIAVAWACAFLPTILLGAIVTSALPGVGQPQLDVGGWSSLALIVLFAPLLETLIMGAALVILQRLMPPTSAVLVSAAGWGAAHSAAAPAWGLVIWWPFVIFSVMFVTWRQRSLLTGLAMAAATHALHNLLPALLLLAGTPT